MCLLYTKLLPFSVIDSYLNWIGWPGPHLECVWKICSMQLWRSVNCVSLAYTICEWTADDQAVARQETEWWLYDLLFGFTLIHTQSNTSHDYLFFLELLIMLSSHNMPPRPNDKNDSVTELLWMFSKFKGLVNNILWL